METTNITFTEEPTNITFNSTLDNCTDDLAFKSEVGLANVLIIPYDLPEDDNTFEGKNLFPVGTTDFFRYLREKAPSELRIDIATKDEDYLELAQHSDLVIIPTIIASALVLPVVQGLITNYIYDKLKVEKTTVRCKIIKTNPDGDNKILEYEGPAAQYEKTVSDFLK